MRLSYQLQAFYLRLLRGRKARLRLMVALWLGLALPTFAQQASPPPDAAIELAPATPPADAAIDPGAVTPSATPTPASDINGKLRFGVLCLSNSSVCTGDIVIVEDEAGWWVDAKVLDVLGGKKPEKTRIIKGAVWHNIPLSQITWDETTQKLVWERPLLERSSQSIVDQSMPPINEHAGSHPALVANYTLNVDEKANATLAVQSTWARGNTALFAGGVWSQEGFVRDLWRVEHDDVNRQLRYTIGEQIIRPGDALGGASTITGLGVQRAFDTSPLTATSPRPGLHGVIDQPGTIEIYNNGRLISTTPIQPGPYQWGNAPLGSGSQQLQLVFRGADGTRTELSSSFFYGSNRALNKGLTDFAVRVGKPPQTNVSQDTAWQGWVRHGFSPWLTAGGRVEGQGDMRNAGVDATVGIGIGSLDMAYARDSRGAKAWSANVGVSKNGFDAQVGRTKLDADYWFLGQDVRVFGGNARVIDERTASMGYGNGVFSVAATGAQRFAVDGTRTRSAGLTMTWRSSRDWRWFATYDRLYLDGATPDRYQASVGVTIPLGKKGTQEVDIRALQSERGEGGQLGWTRHRQSLYGWSANASVFDLPTGERGVVAGYENAMQKGTLSLSGVASNVQQFGLATWSGSVVRANDQWTLGAPGQGPRVQVDASDAPEAVVLRDNQVVGKAGKKGRMVDNLGAYSPVTIALDPNTLPLEADTGGLTKTIITPRVGVVNLKFDTTAQGQMEGLLLIDGQPAKLGLLTLEDGREAWVGETGRLWVPGGKAGTYSGVWTDGTDKKSCTVKFEGTPLRISDASCH